MNLRLSLEKLTLGVLLETIARILFGATEVRIVIEANGFNTQARFSIPNSRTQSTRVYYEGGKLRFANLAGVFFPFDQLPKITKLFEILDENNFEEQLKTAHSLLLKMLPTSYLDANIVKDYIKTQYILKQLGLAEFKQFRDFCKIDFETVR